MENNRKPGVKAHRNRDYFYKLLQEGSFKDAVEKSKNGIYDIVLWGNWSEKKLWVGINVLCIISSAQWFKL